MSPKAKSQPPKDEKAPKDLQEQLQKITEVAARAQADLQNFKQRQKKDAEDLRKFATVPLLLELLPVREDLARAAEQSEDEGIAQILAKLERTLAGVGLTKIEAESQPFDPSKHEVLNTAPGEKDIVIVVHEEGYELHGRVLRPAKVTVGTGL